MMRKSAEEEEIKGKDGKYRIYLPVYMGLEYEGKCIICHLCLWFPPHLHFFAPY